MTSSGIFFSENKNNLFFKGFLGVYTYDLDLMYDDLS